MTTLEIFDALKAAIAAIPLDEGDPQGAKLFEAVELYRDQQLPQALQELLVVKKRACVIVPLNIRRVTSDGSGAISVLGRKVAEVAIVYSDVAYFKAPQRVVFGAAGNLGLFAFDEKIEAALTGKELSPFGTIVLGDSDPVTLSVAEQKAAPGRSAWLVQAFVPVGLIATETFE